MTTNVTSGPPSATTEATSRAEMLPAQMGGRSALRGIVAAQETWITVAIVLIGLLVALWAPRFATTANIYNVAQNFSYLALLTLAILPVIMSGGIDISVGSILGFSAVLLGLTMSGGQPLALGILAALAGGLGLGLVNGVLVAVLGLPSFIVTLAMLSAARSLTMVVSDNVIIYDFGPDGPLLAALGGGSTLGLPNLLWAVLVAAVVVQVLLSMTRWGRYVRAIGGNEDAARATGIPVALVKASVYAFSGLMCGLAAVLLVGQLGSVTNNLGNGYELGAIAAAVIGGANLLGGYGTAYGAVVGALLLEVIRNSLVLAGVNAFWQGMFVGGFIVLAVLLERVRSLRR